MLYQIVNPSKPIPVGRAVKRTPSEKVEPVSVISTKEIDFGLIATRRVKGSVRGALVAVYQ